MQMNELFLGQLEREAQKSRKALERVPEHHTDWRPHPKSMPLGYLATLVATMPSWVVHTIEQDELDLQPPGGKPFRPPVFATRAELIAALDDSMAKARESLQRATDEHLLKPWRFMVAGRVVSEDPRHVVLFDSVLAHMAHHRGQLSVYLRLNDEKVPAMYGPSADEPF